MTDPSTPPGLDPATPRVIVPESPRFDTTLRHTLTTNLEAHDRHEIVDHDLRAAAVAVVVTADADGRAGFVLTRRSARLRTHSRQYALPGGRIDPGESAACTARRELAEEVGLVLGDDAVLGGLDDYRTRSGYVISPVVFWAEGAVELAASEDEVDEIFVIGLGELARPDSPRWFSIDESDRPVLQLPFGDQVVHAPTGAILHQFHEVAVRGHPTRIDMVEEPHWAWR